ncbi:MAG: hypothetical protein RL266_1234 [Bacteroidota bacterium]
MRSLALLISASLVVLSVAGCKTGKMATTPSGLPRITTAELLDSVNTNSYTFLSAKLNVNHSNEKGTQSFGARVRMKKDSVIWVSITPAMGIEVVRVVITPDSIKMVNRLDQKYFVESFSKTNELLQLEINYQVLQSVLTGEFVPLYEEAVYSLMPLVDLYTLVADSNKIRSSNATLKLEQRTEFDPSIWRVTRTILRNPPRNEQILAEYTDFLQVESKVFPTTMRFRTQGKENIAVDLSWSKIEEKPTLRFPFNVPNKYVPY